MTQISFVQLIDFYTFYDMFYSIFQNLGFEKSSAWMSYIAAGGSLSFLAINLLVLDIMS